MHENCPNVKYKCKSKQNPLLNDFKSKAVDLKITIRKFLEECKPPELIFWN